ncbi:hypothetical protein LGQ02_15675 [Bacillus shivajii]|uniref:hypothetical protein n=1 Tax=Bacillus shivajii TaxID=1983719 RepID=UPI001CFB9FE4|nr:hypothetical protein [Bacillus shivajii]UCZ52271.1 hypothetical protein LGQ02_15675 [Bacillus shivajii]
MRFPFLLILTSFLLITSCSQSKSEPPIVVSNGEKEVNIIFENEVSSLTEFEYQELTEEATNILEENPVSSEEAERWFIRYYIQKEESRETWTNDEMLKMAEERVDYEKAWKAYAYLEYGISATEEAIESQIQYNLEVYRNSLPPAIQGISSGLDITIEEYLIEFDRDHVERTVTWQKLMPILLEKHRNESAERLDGVYLGKKFEEEVREYMETQSHGEQ